MFHDKRIASLFQLVTSDFARFPYRETSNRPRAHVLITTAPPLIIASPTQLLFDGAMIAATRRWFRRNRNNLLIGAGVIGAGYLAGQYVLGKLQEARQRMSEDRVAKEKYALSSLIFYIESSKVRLQC